MRVCEFCNNEYDDVQLEFCVSCGAKLKRIYDPFDRTDSINSAPEKTFYGKSICIRVVLGLIIISITALIKMIFFQQEEVQMDEKQVMTNYSTDLSYINEPNNNESEFFTYDLMKQIVECIWPDSEINAELLNCITYLKLFKDDDILEVYYGFDDPYDKEFKSEQFYISAISNINSMLELKWFTGLIKLETNISLLPSDIEALYNLKYLTCKYNGNNLSQFKNLNLLETLIISDYSYDSLQGIENLTMLKELSLEKCNIKSLYSITRCKSLLSFSIKNCNKIEDLNIIGDFVGLTSLSITDSDNIDFNFIGKLKMLKKLTISNTKTKTLEFVDELPNLEYLCLYRNSDAKIMPSFHRLAGSLKELIFDASELDNVDFLITLTNLKKLNIRNTPSVKPLSGMLKLQELTISPGWKVDSLSPLGDLKQLKKLTFVENMGFTPLNNDVFLFLSKLTKLEELSFENCGYYFNADYVYKLTNLKKLNFSGNTVCGDFSGIKNLINLESLNLANTHFARDFQVTSDGFITNISISGEQNMDSQVSSISTLTELKVLDVSNTDLQDISFLKNLKHLEYFYANDNYITDVYVISELPSLKVIDLSANAVKNWEQLDSMYDTQIIGKP